MKKTSKQHPASYDEALEYFSTLSGLPVTYQKQMLFADLFNAKGKRKYLAKNITVVDIYGKEHEYSIGGLRFDNAIRNIQARYFLVTLRHHILDHKIPYEAIRDIRVDAGGGCHSFERCFKYKDFFFIMT